MSEKAAANRSKVAAYGDDLWAAQGPSQALIPDLVKDLNHRTYFVTKQGLAGVGMPVRGTLARRRDRVDPRDDLSVRYERREERGTLSSGFSRPGELGAVRLSRRRW